MSRPTKFACGCGRVLQADFVEAVIPGGMMGLLRSVIVSFRCECEPEREMNRRYYAAADAIEPLTRGQGIPYRNPCPLIPVPGDHPDLRAWRYLLNQYCHDVSAFIAELDLA